MSFLGFCKKKDENNDDLKTGGPVKINWLSKKPGMSQIYKQGLEYCFISHDWKQCCPFVFCKDFLQDAVQAVHHGKAIGIYGFTYNPATCEPLYMERTRIALANAHDPEFASKVPNAVDFLNQFEKQLKLVRTVARPCSNSQKTYANGIFIFDASSRWMISPPMLSMYTLLLRIGFCHTKDEDYAETIKKVIEGKIVPYQRDDKVYLTSAKAGIDKILKYGYSRIFYKDPKKNFPDCNTSSMHNSSGIVSFSTGTSKSVVNHWHRNIEKIETKKKNKKD